MKRNEILEILKNSYGCTLCAGGNDGLTRVIDYLESLRADVKIVGMAYSTNDQSFVITEPDMPRHGVVRIEVLAAHPDLIASSVESLDVPDVLS